MKFGANVAAGAPAGSGMDPMLAGRGALPLPPNFEKLLQQGRLGALPMPPGMTNGPGSLPFPSGMPGNKRHLPPDVLVGWLFLHRFG